MARLLYREWFVEFRFPGHEGVPMRETAIGLVPEGWEVKKLDHVIELVYGKALTANKRVPGPFPVYGSAGIVGYHSESSVEGPGTIVGRKGNVGSVFWSDNDFYPIDTVFYVKTDLCLHYLFYNLQTQNFINNDAAVPGLNRNQVLSLPIIIPTCSLLNRFQQHIEDIFKQTRNLRGRNTNLRRTRDLLLPRLVSGELDVAALEVAGMAFQG